MQRFFAYSPHMTSSCIRVLLPDHTYDRLNKLRDDIKAFVAERVAKDPELSKVTLQYLGGESGLYLAANDVLKQLDLSNYRGMGNVELFTRTCEASWVSHGLKHF